MSRAGLHLLERLFDGLVATEIHRKRFDLTRGLGTLLAERINSRLRLLTRATAKENVIWLARSEQGFDRLVADAAVGAGHDNNFCCGCHDNFTGNFVSSLSQRVCSGIPTAPASSSLFISSQGRSFRSDFEVLLSASDLV